MPARPPSRQPLTPERIISAAVRVADQGGAAAVSMRRIADALGVEAMALYHHVPNKEAILDRAVDAVFAEIDLPTPKQEWRTALEARCWSARQTLTRHSWVLTLIESRDHVGPARLRHHDAVLGVMLDAGLAAVAAVQAMSMLDSYVYGFVLQEQQQRIDTPQETEQAASDLLADLDADDLPHLRAVAEAISSGPAPSHDDTFAHGLRVLLDGLQPA